MIAIEPQLHVRSPSLSSSLNTTERVAIKYINQHIPSPCGMLDYCTLTTLHSLSHVIVNHDNTLMNVVSAPCFNVNIVKSYMELIEYKDVLLKQRKCLSRSETSFEYISKEHRENASCVIDILAENRKRGGVYSQAILFQDHYVECWSGKKTNARLCPLPIMAEGETTILGTAVVLLNILHLSGLIEIKKIVDR